MQTAHARQPYAPALYYAQFYRIWVINSLLVWHRIPLGCSLPDRNTRYFLSGLYRRIEPDSSPQLYKY